MFWTIVLHHTHTPQARIIWRATDKEGGIDAFSTLGMGESIDIWGFSDSANLPRFVGQLWIFLNGSRNNLFIILHVSKLAHFCLQFCRLYRITVFWENDCICVHLQIVLTPGNQMFLEFSGIILGMGFVLLFFLGMRKGDWPQRIQLPLCLR